MSLIHPTAIIEKGAEIDSSARIGAYCVVGANVKIAAKVELLSHVVVAGETEIGEGTKIFPFASIGSEPQDLKFKGEKSQLIIGKNNKIREYVTMNGGTEGGGNFTKVGDNCLFMISSHVAHDCVIGNNVIIANNVSLAGHVTVGDFAIIGGHSAVHQFARIGAQAMIGGMSAIENDVIPFATAVGERAKLAGLNLIGLKRRGFEREEIHSLRNAYKLLFSDEGNLEERIKKTKSQFGSSVVVQEIIKFLEADTSRAICQPRSLDNYE